MNDTYTRNDKLFFLINIGVGLLTFVLYSMQDTAGIVLLFLPILLVNAVISLATIQFIKKVRNEDTGLFVLLKILFTIIVNIITYVFIVMYIYKILSV